MKKYQVLQGVLNNQGNGQIDLIEEFSNYKEAIKFFNKIKNDKKGWIIGKHEHLETYLLKNNDYDDILGYWSC